MTPRFLARTDRGIKLTSVELEHGVEQGEKRSVLDKVTDDIKQVMMADKQLDVHVWGLGERTSEGITVESGDKNGIYNHANGC